jgi:hypothetical protein
LKLPPALAPLTAQNRWVVWRWRDGAKVPYQARHPDRYASTTDPSTWAPFAEARGDKVGFVLAGSRIGALDLDDCRDARTGALTPWAKRLIRKAAGSYCEVTPSGCGLRIIGRAHGEKVHCKVPMRGGQVEVYRDCERYICITGDELGACARLRLIDDLIDELGEPAVAAAPCERRASSLTPHAIIAKHHIKGMLARELLTGKQVGSERRHRMHWKLARGLREAGVDASEAFTVLWASGWNKHTNPEAVWKLVGKIWK